MARLGSPLSAAPAITSVSRRTRRRLGIAMLVVSALLALWPGTAPAQSILRDYVRTPDPAYGFRHVTTATHPGCTIHVLSMTSQRWRSSAQVNRTRWQHWMAVVVPDKV